VPVRQQCALEFTLLDRARATDWNDIVVRAELTAWRRRNSLRGYWIELDAEHAGTRFAAERSFSELLTAILRLGVCPLFADVDMPFGKKSRPTSG
jgi:hypothetical protein